MELLCPNCNQQALPGARFCIHCGTRLSAPAGDASVPHAQNAPGAPPSVAPAPVQGSRDVYTFAQAPAARHSDGSLSKLPEEAALPVPGTPTAQPTAPPCAQIGDVYTARSESAAPIDVPWNLAPQQQRSADVVGHDRGAGDLSGVFAPKPEGLSEAVPPGAGAATGQAPLHLPAAQSGGSVPGWIPLPPSVPHSAFQNSALPGAPRIEMPAPKPAPVGGDVIDNQPYASSYTVPVPASANNGAHVPGGVSQAGYPLQPSPEFGDAPSAQTAQNAPAQYAGFASPDGSQPNQGGIFVAVPPDFAVPAGEQPPPAPEPPPMPSDYLAWNILLCLLCCSIMGLVGIIYSAKVKPAYQAGNYAECDSSARIAKSMFWIGFGMMLVCGVIIFVIGGVTALQNL